MCIEIKKDYMVYDHLGNTFHQDEPGEKFKYRCIHTNLKTREVSETPCIEQFVNHAAFRACLKLWTEQGRRHNIHRWRYEPAKL